MPILFSHRFADRITSLKSTVACIILSIVVAHSLSCVTEEDKAWEQLILARNRALNEMRLTEALELAGQCQTYAAKRFGDPSRELAASFSATGIVLSRLGNFNEADSVFQESIQTHLKANDTLSREYSTSLFNYGKFCRERNRSSLAVSLLERTRHQHAHLFEIDPNSDRLLTRELAKAKSLNREYREAKELFYELVDSDIVKSDTMNSYFVDALFEIGVIHWKLQQYDSAIAYETRVLSLASVDSAALLEDSSEVMRVLGKCYWEQGDTVTAIVMMRRALRAATTDSRPDHFSIAMIMCNLGAQLMEAEELEEADSLATAVIASCSAMEYLSRELCIRAVVLRAEISQKRGNCREAIRFGTEALSKCQEWAPGVLESKAQCLGFLASFEFECGSKEIALEQIQEAIKIADSSDVFSRKTKDRYLELRAKILASPK